MVFAISCYFGPCFDESQKYSSYAAVFIYLDQFFPIQINKMICNHLSACSILKNNWSQNINKSSKLYLQKIIKQHDNSEIVFIINFYQHKIMCLVYIQQRLSKILMQNHS